MESSKVTQVLSLTKQAGVRQAAALFSIFALVSCGQWNLPAVGQNEVIRTPILACTTKKMTLNLLQAARNKDSQAFLGNMLGSGGSCLQMPSGVGLVVTDIDSQSMLAGVRLADAPNGGTFWTPLQMLNATTSPQ